MRSVESDYVRLARESIEKFIREDETLHFKHSRYFAIPELKSVRKGVFVSIKDSGGLRGCIGTYRPSENCLGEEIVHNAISACSKDPRFPVVGIEELNDLTITVDILESPEETKNIDELDSQIYGVIVTSGFRKGLLLPHLKGIDTVEEQLKIARKKAGIPKNEEVRIERFKVERYY
jgi:AmmeMemoRadiSam system protein A